MKDPLILTSSVALFALLAFTQILIAFLAKRKPEKDFTEVRVRTRSWCIMILILELTFYFGSQAIVGLMTCLSFFALREYLSQIPTRIPDRKVLFWVFLSIPIQFYLVYRQWLVPFLCFIPLYGISIIALRLLLAGPPRGFMLALSSFQLGLLTTVYSVSHMAYLPFISQSSTSSNYEVEIGTLLFFIFVTQANDVFQFISGKAFGRHKIMPLISPKKTVEGFLGGVIISAMVSAGIAPLLTPLSPFQGMAAGILLAVFGFFGDVLMSAIKRDLEIKDFSQLIPGHGGILDRIDSLIISAPLYFHFIRVLSEGIR